MTNIFLTTEDKIQLLGILITVVLTVIGGLYAVLTNTKKYELTEEYKRELLAWYSDVVEIMMLVIHYAETKKWRNHPNRVEILAKISLLAECGRFYFPNINEKEGYGKEKPAAYQGVRHIVLEFVLFFYKEIKTAEEPDLNRLWKLERGFTSYVFQVINPPKRNKTYSNYLQINLKENETLKAYLQKNEKEKETFFG